MARLLLAVVLEIVAALGVAGVVLAIVIPLLIHTELMSLGDVTGRVVVTGILVVAVAATLLRPGSAIHRYGERDR
jgi:hypothetical protein